MWISDMFTGRKQNRFYDLLGRHCAYLTEAAETLERYVANGSPELSDRVDEIEKSADRVLSETIDALNDTFITPIDRQDIYNLAETIDDMIDYLNNAAREIKLFHTGSTPEMVEMVAILAHAANEVRDGVRALAHEPHGAIEHGLNACSAENAMEDLYRQTVAALFEGADFNRILKLREIYRHLGNSADRADAIGRLIGKIVVKVA